MDSLPKRKQNRLTGYDYSQPGCYFVTICSRDREHLFGCVVGADVLIGPHVQLSEIGAIVEQTISQIPSVDKYIVMPNHVHILLRLPVANNGPMGTSAPTQSVPWIVRYLKRTVTMACGKTVWQHHPQRGGLSPHLGLHRHQPRQVAGGLLLLPGREGDLAVTHSYFIPLRPPAGGHMGPPLQRARDLPPHPSRPPVVPPSPQGEGLRATARVAPTAETGP